MRLLFLAAMFSFRFDLHQSFGESNFDTVGEGFKAEAIEQGISSSLLDQGF